jgi:hypothetical protein
MAAAREFRRVRASLHAVSRGIQVGDQLPAELVCQARDGKHRSIQKWALTRCEAKARVSLQEALGSLAVRNVLEGVRGDVVQDTRERDDDQAAREM